MYTNNLTLNLQKEELQKLLALAKSEGLEKELEGKEPKFGDQDPEEIQNRAKAIKVIRQIEMAFILLKDPKQLFTYAFIYLFQMYPHVYFLYHF